MSTPPPVPPGYTSWNDYIDYQGSISPDPALTKRDIKLGMIAQVERQAGGDTSSPSYRPYNVYTSPGTVSPAEGHPWTLT